MYTPAMPMMDPTQPRNNYGYYKDWAAWEDNNPAVISIKQWRDHTQAAQNACTSAQENGKTIENAKSAIKSDIKEAQKAMKETVNSAESHVKETRDAVGLAHDCIKEAQLAIHKTQDTINDNHAEQLSKQQACAADVARVRQLLEEEAKKREETRQVEQMVQYAQSQGLLQPQAPVRRGQSSPNSSPATSVSSRAHEQEQWSRRREQEAERRRHHLERQMEQFEQQHHVSYTRAIEDAVNAEMRIQAGHERLARARGELEFLRRSHHPRIPYQSADYDEAMEAPYPYSSESAVGGSGGVGRQVPRWGAFRCGNERM